MQFFQIIWRLEANISPTGFSYSNGCCFQISMTGFEKLADKNLRDISLSSCRTFVKSRMKTLWIKHTNKQCSLTSF